jgi:hypothetical protein
MNETIDGAHPAMMGDVSSKPVERRKTNRFPIHQDLQFRVLNREGKPTGAGRTIDFSSRGIRFICNDAPGPGSVLEVSINWPARLDGTCPMKIVAVGPVLRVNGNEVALRITRYEFRTRSSRTAQAAGLNAL